MYLVFDVCFNWICGEICKHTKKHLHVKYYITLAFMIINLFKEYRMYCRLFTLNVMWGCCDGGSSSKLLLKKQKNKK